MHARWVRRSEVRTSGHQVKQNMAANGDLSYVGFIPLRGQVGQPYFNAV